MSTLPSSPKAIHTEMYSLRRDNDENSIHPDAPKTRSMP